jgi:FlaA1/EpsC-like NDP-sugar epimerase
VKGITAQDSPDNASSAESRRKGAVPSGGIFRALRNLASLLDASIILAALAGATGIEWQTPQFWQVGTLSNVPTWKLLAVFAVFAVVLLWTSSHHYDSAPPRCTLFREQKLNLQDCALSAVVLVSMLYLSGAEALSRSFVALFLFLVASGLGVRRLIYRTFPAEPGGARHVLIIGADSRALAIREQLRTDPELGYIFKGFVKLSNSEPGSIDDQSEVVGTVDKLAEHVCKYSVNELFLTPSCSRELALKLVSQARELGIHSRMVLGHLRLGMNQTKSHS